MASSPQAFVRRHTSLRPVPGLNEIRLHLTHDVLELWREVQLERRDPDAALPYWAIAWAGGLAVARYLCDHPDAIVGRRVFDFASGSGLCAIVAARSGASDVTAADVDSFAAAAIRLNAAVNGCRIGVVYRDILDEEPPDTDVLIAADCWYEGRLAERVLPWLQRARDRGIEVLVGDPNRDYLPASHLVELARYQVRTTSELDDLAKTNGWVYALRRNGASSP